MSDLFESESLEVLKTDSFQVVVSPQRRKQIFQKLGYDILKTGFLKDKLANKNVTGIDNQPLNINETPNVALISGSHNFVRNIAEYSDILAKRGDLKLIPEED